MSSPSTAAAEPTAAALEQLRRVGNPFRFTVVTAGTDDVCAAVDVPELIAGQLSDLREIVARYRDGHPPSQVFPVIGQTGAGKSHLLNRLVAELHREAVETGRESVVLTTGHVPLNINGVNFLYRLLTSHLLEPDGPGARTLSAVAGRLTGRGLSEALRQTPPHRLLELIPTAGLFAQFWQRVGNSEAARKKLEAVAALTAEFDRPNLHPEQVRRACTAAGVPASAILGLFGRHLEKSESNDALGWVRRQLYARLATYTLTDDRGPFEELLTGEVEDLPPHLMPATADATAAGITPRVIDYYLLTAWIELFDELGVPAMLIIDNIEEPLRHPTPDAATVAAKAFTQALASIITRVPDVCIFLLTEVGQWYDLIERADTYAKERLTQTFQLTGRPPQRFIPLANTFDAAVVERLIRRRVQAECPDLNWTGLPGTFPFDRDELPDLIAGESTVRGCLTRLAKRYDEIVTGSIKPRFDPVTFRTLLDDRWKAAVASTRKEIGRDGIYTAAKVYDVQVALDGWLRLLADEGTTGTGPWTTVELLHVEFRRQYGYLNLIRTDGPDAPGIGIAAWLAEGGATANDLRRRIEFFDDNPCPVRTLILLRRDGKDAIRGTAKGHYDDARAAGRDVRVHKFEPKHAHALFALDRWRQAVGPEVQAVGDAGRSVYREKLADLSAEFLGWIDGWRSPAGGTK